MKNKQTSTWKTDHFDKVFSNFENMFDGLFALKTDDSKTPKINAIYNKDSVVIKAELPGMSKEEISVKLEDSVLTISGERELDKDIKYYSKEIWEGEFSRSFELKFPVIESDVQAKYDNGILTVTLPRSEKENSTNIKID